jgi:transposase-like protein
MYLYRAVDSNGDTVGFQFSERRDLTAAKRFLRKALSRHWWPEGIVIDGSQTNREAILLQDRSMLGFKLVVSARVSLGGIGLIHMIRKGQAKYACNPPLHWQSSLSCLPPECTIGRLPFPCLSQQFATQP